jgi:hypothetical protein
MSVLVPDGVVVNSSGFLVSENSPTDLKMSDTFREGGFLFSFSSREALVSFGPNE